MTTRGPLLNVDGGELEDEPAELYAIADVVHVACGGHAGDDASMERVTRACASAGTRVGAHPSYEDREGFGRRPREVAPEELARSVAAQCARHGAIAARVGTPLASVKPHGALYGEAMKDAAIAEAVAQASAELEKAISIYPGSQAPQQQEIDRTVGRLLNANS